MTSYALYCAKAAVFLGTYVFLICGTYAFEAWYGQWLKRQFWKCVLAMLEYLHVWKEAKFRVVNNTISK